MRFLLKFPPWFVGLSVNKLRDVANIGDDVRDDLLVSGERGRTARPASGVASASAGAVCKGKVCRARLCVRLQVGKKSVSVPGEHPLIGATGLFVWQIELPAG